VSQGAPKRYQSPDTAKALFAQIKDMEAAIGKDVGAARAAAWREAVQLAFNENGIATIPAVLPESAYREAYLPGDAIAAYHLAMAWWQAMRMPDGWGHFAKVVLEQQWSVDQQALVMAIANALGKAERLADREHEKTDQGRAAGKQHRHRYRDRALAAYDAATGTQAARIRAAKASLRFAGTAEDDIPSDRSIKNWISARAKVVK
jgi:hypothetical protein